MPIKYVIKKLIVSFLTILVVVLITFCVLRAMPGDIYEQATRAEATTSHTSYAQARATVILRFNYDPKEPILKQLGRYMSSISKGNLGVSMINPRNTVVNILGTALPWTLFSVSIALVVSFALGIQLGAIMAIKRKGVINNIITVYVTAVSTIPSYVIAMILSIIFIYNLNWFPMSGCYGINTKPGVNLPFIGSALWHAVLPIATYIISSTGAWILQMKGTAISTLGSDYVFAARARGIRERTIIKKYMKKNAMIPLVTTLAMCFGGMIGGSVLIESQFQYLGVGTFLNKALSERDFVLYQGILLIVSFSVIIANLVADLLYAMLDPRIKLD